MKNYKEEKYNIFDAQVYGVHSWCTSKTSDGERVTGRDIKQDNHFLGIFAYLLNDILYNSQQTYYCGFPIAVKTTFESKSNV